MPVGRSIVDKITVKSEADAWRFLAQALDGHGIGFEDLKSVRFEGWPALDIYIDVGKASIKPTLMRSLVDLQDSIWRSYSIVKYGEANISFLSDEERSVLEFEVFVRSGSSQITAPAWRVLDAFVPEFVKKMDGKQIVITILGIAVLHYGSTVWNAHLQSRLDEHRAELMQAEKLAMLETQKFISERELEKMRLLEEAYKKVAVLKEINEEAERARISIFKSLPPNSSARLQGSTTITGSLANRLASNPREHGHEHRIEGTFSVVQVDTRRDEGFRVQLRNLATGQSIPAVLPDDLDDEETRATVEQATWRKQPLQCVLDITRRRGKIVKAIIIKATKVEGGWKTTVRAAKRPGTVTAH